MTAYYNENDPKAAAWLRELIKGGHIAHGVVDERSIEDVLPNDLRDFTQCHFFAGIGGWSYALRLAGWPDDKPVWTGSCPCQPFSAAGKGGGFTDERHLWPAFFHLIGVRLPPVVFGEQVASPPGLVWLDRVSADLEGTGYAVGAADLCAAGVGAPHIRQRLYWVAHHYTAGRGQQRSEELLDGERAAQRNDSNGRSSISGLADSAEQGRESWGRDTGQSDGRGTPRIESGRLRDAGELGNSGGAGLPQQFREPGAPREALSGNPWQAPERTGASTVWCRDGKYRPVEPGTFPLAHGVSGRVGLLRGYGNAIVPQVAAAFIGASNLT